MCNKHSNKVDKYAKATQDMQAKIMEWFLLMKTHHLDILALRVVLDLLG